MGEVERESGETEVETFAHWVRTLRLTVDLLEEYRGAYRRERETRSKTH